MTASDLRSDSAPQPAKPRRRWYQFSLRTAGIGIFLLCLLLGTFAWWRDRAERQRKVVEELRTLGVTVNYHFFSLKQQQGIFNKTYFRTTSSKEFFLCSWIRHCLGDDFVSNVDYVAIPRNTPHVPLTLLQACPHIKHLTLEGKAVSGPDLEKLPCIEELEYLSLECSDSIQFLNDDLAVLERATSLQLLDLKGQPIGDSGLAHLRNCRRLQVLSLENTSVRDEGLQHLSELRELELLDLSDTQVTDRGLKHLRNLNQLTRLDLDGDAITGEGLADVGPKSQLLDLNTRRTMFTDDALRHLKQFPKLEFFALDRTQVTGAGIRHLAIFTGVTGTEGGNSGICLNGCPVTDETIAGIEIPDGWQVVWLDDTRITDKGFCKIKRV